MEGVHTKGSLFAGATLVALVLGAVVLTLTPGSAAANPGDVYVADSNAPTPNGPGTIFRIGPAGGDATPVASGGLMSNPTGMVMGRDGNLLIADFGQAAGSIILVNPRSGGVSTFASGPPFAFPNDLAFGPDGMLYVIDFGPGPSFIPTIIRLDPSSRTAKPIATGGAEWDNAGSIAVSRDGTIFFTDFGDEVFKRDPRSGGITKLAEGLPLLDGVDGLALSPDDRTLFVASTADGTGTGFFGPPNRVSRVDTATGAVSAVATLSDSTAVSLLPDGSLLNSDVEAGSDGFQGIQRISGIDGGTPVISTFSSDSEYQYPHDTLVEPQRCAGRIPTVVGTTGPDRLVGSPFPDVFSTLGGKDKVKARGGNDVVCGGPANDKLVGGPGSDRLLGEQGRDLLKGSKGKDVCRGGKGVDRGRGCEKGQTGSHEVG
jgi:sugar lactone lactonase YvrE